MITAAMVREVPFSLMRNGNSCVNMQLFDCRGLCHDETLPCLPLT